MTGQATAVEIYTDGACSGNPGPGGWGAVLKYGRHEKEFRGGEAAETTNNRMELTAAIRALEKLRWPCTVVIHTDSAYVRDGVTKWLTRWKANGWRTQSKDPVKNVDLWQELEAAMEPHQVTWVWVRGHAGDPGNERADRLAAEGLREAVSAQAARPAQAETSAAAADADDCVHEMPIGWCGLCKAPPSGVLSHGYRTRGGNAYHNDRNCTWLHRGQRYAERRGQNIHDIERVSWNAVEPGKLEPCESCCTDQWMARHGHSRPAPKQ